MTIFKQRLRHHRKKKELKITSLYGSCWHVASHVLVEKEKWNCGNVKREIRTWEKQKEEKKSEVKRKKKEESWRKRDNTERKFAMRSKPDYCQPLPHPHPLVQAGGGVEDKPALRNHVSSAPPLCSVPVMAWWLRPGCDRVALIIVLIMRRIYFIAPDHACAQVMHAEWIVPRQVERHSYRVVS